MEALKVLTLHREVPAQARLKRAHCTLVGHRSCLAEMESLFYGANKVKDTYSPLFLKFPLEHLDPPLQGRVIFLAPAPPHRMVASTQ